MCCAAGKLSGAQQSPPMTALCASVKRLLKEHGFSASSAVITSYSPNIAREALSAQGTPFRWQLIAGNALSLSRA